MATISGFLNSLNNLLPPQLRNHRLCTGGADPKYRAVNQRLDKNRSGAMFDAQRALWREQWCAAEDHFERAISQLPMNTFPAVALCETFDQGETALRLMRAGERLVPTGTLAGLRVDMANLHAKHYRRCHRKRDLELANAYSST